MVFRFRTAIPATVWHGTPATWRERARKPPRAARAGSRLTTCQGPAVRFVINVASNGNCDDTTGCGTRERNRGRPSKSWDVSLVG
ncbi:hypothetical protein SCATT_54980 [Streptantibioticus cattleyicolor NRRL 8057 = DSM 46488]|uniref:Uncharacterized protein n=1 Tax=Streptantibioticus cattleyicolor (strain ATCC 35852 / DSM 46488 / JCM 4925 / NBRC 14057 / NRRL 8057) TaxID=1003195 RepID=G8WY98_STREN|nr:hypothetical protein SCATT_54980 [Streptantibioticus cattleyicolor NRRL 8057 = DSM 46488]